MTDSDFLRDWVSQDIQRQSDFASAALEVLTEADNKCKACMAGAPDVMLCAGVRPQLNHNKLSLYGEASLVATACQKLTAKTDASTINRRLAESGIPATFYNECPIYEGLTVSLESGIIIASKAQAAQLRVDFQLPMTKYLWGVAVHTIRQGYSVRYVCPALEATSTRQVSFEDVAEIAEKTDLLIVERVNCIDGRKFVREKLYGALLNRILLGKPTIATLTREDVGVFTEVESQVIQAVKSWEVLQ